MPEEPVLNLTEPGPCDAGKPELHAPTEQPPAALVCPRCRFAIGSADDLRCPECGAAVRLGYIGHWVVDTKRLMKRATLFLFVLSFVHFGAAAYMLWGDIAGWYFHRWWTSDVGWLTQLVMAFEETWEAERWPHWAGAGATMLLACYAVWVTKKNLLPRSENTDPETDHAFLAWRRVKRLAILTIMVAGVHLAMNWVYYRYIWWWY